MIVTVETLLNVADRYMALAGIDEEKTLSYRVFGDSKKLTALRGTADITLSRCNAAMTWFAAQWPGEHDMPNELRPYAALASNPMNEFPHDNPPEDRASDAA